MLRTLLSSPVALLVLGLLAACSDSPPEFRGTAIPDVDWGRNFSHSPALALPVGAHCSTESAPVEDIVHDLRLLLKQ